jgi:hypothetical protein
VEWWEICEEIGVWRKSQMAERKWQNAPTQSHVLFGALRLRQPETTALRVGGVLLAVYGLRFTSYDLGLTIWNLRFAPSEHLLVVKREGKS